MSTDAARYRLASHDVVADVIDGEAIIMHLGDGAYYSIAGTGAVAWSLLLEGATCAEAADAIAASTGAPAAVVSAGVGTLLTRVLEEGLLAPDPQRVAPTELAIEANLPYADPVLNKYGDMKEMLALDPPIPEFNG